MEKEKQQLPQNISISLGDKEKRSFLDRHFGSLAGVFGAILAATVAALLSHNLAEVQYVPQFELVAERPVVNSPVKFTVVNIDGILTELSIAKLDGPESAERETVIEEENGILHSWSTENAGNYVAELKLIDNRTGFLKKPSGKIISEANLRFEVYESSDPILTAADTSTATTEPAEIQNDVPEKKNNVTQRFTDQIGNNGSCTESNISKQQEFCLAREYRVVDWEGSYISVNNGSANVQRSQRSDSCVVLTMQYSDSGRGIFGDCKGNGWVNYQVVVNGIEK